MSALRVAETENVHDHCTAPVGQMDLPLSSWDEGMTIDTSAGARLQRWGKLRDMSKMLYDLDREACYMLIKDGEVKGFKLGAGRTCGYRIDLISVWEYRMKHYGR